MHIGEEVEAETFLVTLYTHSEQSSSSLELQRSFYEDDVDKTLGLDTYCVVRDFGKSVHYGGITSCIFKKGKLTFEFDAQTTKVMGLGRLVLKLEMYDEQLFALRDGLQTIFTNRTPTHFEWSGYDLAG